MEKAGRLIDEMNVGKISNPHLRDLVAHLKENLATATDPLTLAPETAQIMLKKRPPHTDYTDHADYTDHTAPHNDYYDYSPPHGDYCD